MSRIVIDAHVHPQRFTPGFLKEGERLTYDKLENASMSELPFDSPLMLADMARLCKLGTVELQRQKEDRYGEQIAWDDLSLRWSSEYEAQPVPAGGRTESEAQLHHD